ncbi:MAG: response regulator [Acidimicrobiia bacterium]|jgi:DNA-binding NarL/FixJ family response regulator
MPSEVTVLLADDEAVVRQAIGELLETDPRFRVVASVDSADAATRAAGRWQPKLAVVDVRMPGGGHAAIAGIRRHSPDTIVMVCSSYDDRHTRNAMEQAGAAAYVVKGADDLLDVAYEVLGLSA